MKRPKTWMSVSRLCFIAVATIIAASSLSAQAAGLTWSRDLNKGLQTAKAAKKWVLVDVYTNWCGWCKKLDTDVYTNPNVVKVLNKSFVLVKVNGEDSSLGKYVKTQYHLEEKYPMIVILSPNGKVKGKIDGYYDAPEFLNQLTEIVGQ